MGSRWRGEPRLWEQRNHYGWHERVKGDLPKARPPAAQAGLGAGLGLRVLL